MSSEIPVGEICPGPGPGSCWRRRQHHDRDLVKLGQDLRPAPAAAGASPTIRRILARKPSHSRSFRIPSASGRARRCGSVRTRSAARAGDHRRGRSVLLPVGQRGLRTHPARGDRVRATTAPPPPSRRARRSTIRSSKISPACSRCPTTTSKPSAAKLSANWPGGLAVRVGVGDEDVRRGAHAAPRSLRPARPAHGVAIPPVTG